MGTITYKDIENIYGMKISKKHKELLGTKILEPYPQAMIKKALKYNLSDKEVTELYKIGKQDKAVEYPGLYYICTIFIHPLTHCQAAIKAYEKLMKVSL